LGFLNEGAVAAGDEVWELRNKKGASFGDAFGKAIKLSLLTAPLLAP
jgi:hypothetical protein